MDNLQGPLLLACSAVTTLFVTWQHRHQQGHIFLPSHGHIREHQSLSRSSVKMIYLILIISAIGMLIPISEIVAIVGLWFLRWDENNPPNSVPIRRLISCICTAFAWMLYLWTAFQERGRGRFPAALKTYWIAALILATLSLVHWIQFGTDTDISKDNLLATIHQVAVIANFVQSLGLFIVGCILELQDRFRDRRASDFQTTGFITPEHESPSTPDGSSTAFSSPLGRAENSNNSNSKGKKKKTKKRASISAAAPGSKEYSRPTTFAQFYEHCRHLAPFIWPSNSRKLQVHIILCLALLVVGRVVNAYLPWQLSNVVNALTEVANGGEGGKDEDGKPRLVWKELSIFIALRALQGNIGAVETLQALLWIPVGQFNTRELGVKIVEHVLSLSPRYHLGRKTGEIIRIQDRGVSSIMTLLSSLLFSILPCLVDILIACIVLTRSFDIYFGLIVAVTMVCYIYVTILMTDWRTRYRREANALDNAVEARAVDSLLNYETIKVFATEDYETGKYAEAIHSYQKADSKSQYTLGILNTALNLVIQGGLALGCLLCAMRVSQREMEVGEFVMYYTYVLQLYGPLALFGTSYRSLQKNFVDMEKMLDLLKEPIEIQDMPDAKALTLSKGEVVFDNVSFGYDPRYPILKSVSFTIPHGKKVALVGRSGSGKSSILRLLYRFYDTTGGRILIDGQDIRHVTQKSLRQKIGVVLQETGLFNESIGYNIGYGKIGLDKSQVFDPTQYPGLALGLQEHREAQASHGLPSKRPSRMRRTSTLSRTGTLHEWSEGLDMEDDYWEDDVRIHAAAEAARIHEYISGFPEGYSKLVGERGIKISGGEKQRVSIARTILKNPPILLLDEATSALDTHTEREIQDSFESTLKDRTTLVVAHRLSTIVDADLILVLRSGEIVERGSHEELMGLQGMYAEMWMKQLSESLNVSTVGPRKDVFCQEAETETEPLNTEESDDEDGDDSLDGMTGVSGNNALLGGMLNRHHHHHHYDCDYYDDYDDEDCCQNSSGRYRRKPMGSNKSTSRSLPAKFSACRHPFPGRLNDSCSQLASGSGSGSGASSGLGTGARTSHDSNRVSIQRGFDTSSSPSSSHRLASTGDRSTSRTGMLSNALMAQGLSTMDVRRGLSEERDSSTDNDMITASPTLSTSSSYLVPLDPTHPHSHHQDQSFI